jgi:hypothetical protein
MEELLYKDQASYEQIKIIIEKIQDLEDLTRNELRVISNITYFVVLFGLVFLV